MYPNDKVQAQFPNIRCVFLDRDGVINRKSPEGQYVRIWEEFHILPGVEAAIADLNRSGRRVVVISNQRGVALGLYTKSDVDALHARLQEHMAGHGARIDGFYYCPHDKKECDCRKPGTGLFKQALRDFPEAAPASSVVIGDSLSDMEAARNFGSASIFIQGDPATQKPGADQGANLADAVCSSLSEAVEKYLV